MSDGSQVRDFNPVANIVAAFLAARLGLQTEFAFSSAVRPGDA